MNKDEQIKALAEFDGWTFDPSVGYWRDSGGYAHGSSKPLPYLTSRDAIIPLIEKMPTENRMEFINVLEDIAYTKDFGNYWDVQFAIITATPQQLSEALLRSTGRWQETK